MRKNYIYCRQKVRQSKTFSIRHEYSYKKVLMEIPNYNQFKKNFWHTFYSTNINKKKLIKLSLISE